MNTNLVAIKIIKKARLTPILMTTTRTTTTEIKFQLEAKLQKCEWNICGILLKDIWEIIQIRMQWQFIHLLFVFFSLHFTTYPENPESWILNSQLENLNYYFIHPSGYYKYLNNLQGHSLHNYDLWIFRYNFWLYIYIFRQSSKSL